MHSVAAQRPSFSKRDSFTKRFSFPKRQSFPKSDVRPPPGAVSQRIDFKTESLESHLDSFRSEHNGPIRRVDSFRRKSWQRANYLCNPDLPERDLYSPATTVSGWSSTETDCALSVSVSLSFSVSFGNSFALAFLPCAFALFSLSSLLRSVVADSCCVRNIWAQAVIAS